jgi:alkylhydroperoxidase family enzyme
VAHHSPLGLRVGLTREKIDGLRDYRTNPVYSDLERLVIRYAEELTRKTELDEGLHKELKAYLSDQEIVELCATVATANFTNRITGALKPELEGH